VVARDPADTPTEQFVPDFDGVSGEEPDNQQEPVTVAGQQSRDGDVGSGDDPGDGVPADSGRSGGPQLSYPDGHPDESGGPDEPADGSGGEPGPVAGVAVQEQHRPGESPDPGPSPGQVEPMRQIGSPGYIRHAGLGQHGVKGGTARTGVGGVRAPGIAGRGTGTPGGTGSVGGAPGPRRDTWRRAVLVGALVLCTGVAGVLTGFAVVRATADWTVTWGGTEQTGSRRSAPKGSRSATPPQFDRPQYPGRTDSSSPAPSVSASTPTPTASPQPSRSPQPRNTQTPGTPPSGSPTPPAESSPSGTGEPDNGG
jgi:hypothetical protein